MNILHIASITGDPCYGVHVVVPQHVQAQQKLANVAILNTKNVSVDGAQKQFSYITPFEIANLPAPFDAPDLVIFHEVYKPEYLSISANLRKNKIPYVLMPHGSLTEKAQQKKRIKKLVGNFLLFNRFINHAKAIQFLSENEKNTSRNCSKGFIGPNGIILPDACKTQFHKDRVKMVFVGRRDVYHKGLDLLLAGIASASDDWENQNTEIALYGPGDQKDISKIDEITDNLQIGHLVKNFDSICGMQKQEALLSADIFVQTSRFEGMPMGILEALSYGVPCLVTEGTNMGEMIRKYDAGWVVQTNVNDIAQGLKLAVSQKEQWSQKSANARKLVEENYLWSKVASDAVGNYRSIMD